MAWTTPRTWSVTDVPTDTLWNTHIRDNEQYLYDRLLLVSGTEVTPVTMTSQNTYYVGSSMSLAAGTWLITASLQVNPSSSDQIDGQIYNSTDAAAILTIGSKQSSGVCGFSLASAVVLAGTKTIQLRARNINSSGGGIATARLTAVRAAV